MTSITGNVCAEIWFTRSAVQTLGNLACPVWRVFVRLTTRELLDASRDGWAWRRVNHRNKREFVFAL
jgi:hypothetical protein